MWESLLAACAPAAWLPGLLASADGWGAAATLALFGLVGGFAHCAGMCGPFVLAQAAAGPGLGRLGGATLLPYHLGRATTYAALGALAGGAIGSLGFAWTRPTALLLGAAVFLAAGLAGFGLLRRRDSFGLGGAVAERIAGLALRAKALGGYGLGVALGFLPCGMIYAALAVAASSGGWRAGAGAMAAFALGTVPALLAVGLAGVFAERRWSVLARATMPPLMLANAGFLGLLAWRSF